MTAQRGVCLIVLGIVLVGTTTARAELQRVEAVGSYGIREQMRTKVIPRDRAIANALWEAVSRVARDLVAERPATGSDAEAPGFDEGSWEVDGSIEASGAATDGEGASRDELAALREALGEDMLPYTQSFQIQQDLGEQAAMFPDQPDVDSEYVVVVEVLVDADRVGSALEQAGLVASGGSGAISELRLELLGLRRYEGFQRVVALLRERMRATEVRPIEFSAERQVLLVQGPFEPRGLSAALAALEDDRLTLEPVGIEESARRIRVVASWLPAPSASGSGDSPPRTGGP